MTHGPWSHPSPHIYEHQTIARLCGKTKPSMEDKGKPFLNSHLM